MNQSFFLALVLFAAVPTDPPQQRTQDECPWHIDYRDGKIVCVPPLPASDHPPPLQSQPAPVAKREPKQVAAFRKVNACPSTQKFTGACKGWVVDHIIPLCWGGADNPANMAWQDKASSYKKDVFEREACAMKKKQQP